MDSMTVRGKVFTSVCLAIRESGSGYTDTMEITSVLKRMFGYDPSDREKIYKAFLWLADNEYIGFDFISDGDPYYAWRNVWIAKGRRGDRRVLVRPEKRVVILSDKGKKYADRYCKMI